MPKPPTHQRPIPINRNWSGGRPGATAPFGKAGRKAPPKAPETGTSGLQLDFSLPKLPPSKK